MAASVAKAANVRIHPVTLSVVAVMGFKMSDWDFEMHWAAGGRIIIEKQQGYWVEILSIDRLDVRGSFVLDRRTPDQTSEVSRTSRNPQELLSTTITRTVSIV